MRFRHADFPDFLRENKKLIPIVVPHLPDDFCRLELTEQKHVVENIQQHILRHSDPNSLRSQELNKLPFALSAKVLPGHTTWPIRLADEMASLILFKLLPQPPIGMFRNRNWRVTTAKMRKKWLAQFFGALLLPVNATDIRLRGLGLSEDQLTLGLTVCPSVVDWYVRFLCVTRSQYSARATALFNFFISLLMNKVGFVRQKPQLADLLTPINAGDVVLLSEELIEKAKLNWDGVCDDAISKYRDLIINIEGAISVSRDPFLRIKGLCEMDDPLQGAAIIVDGIRKDLPNKLTNPIGYHTKIRDMTLVCFFYLLGFRRSTMSKLIYTGDKKGHIWLEEDVWTLEVSRFLFKNPESPYFGPKGKKRDYKGCLEDVFGIYDTLTVYINESHPFIMSKFHPDSLEQPVFPTMQHAKSVGLKAEQMSRIYRGLVAQYLVFNEYKGTGIKDVGPHGPHAARHQRGKKSMRETNSYKVTGDVNHHSDKTAAKHYSDDTPEEKNRVANKVLFSK